VQNGMVRIPDAPGIGIELNSDLYATFQELM
jgi:L-alanine-DL-glutamate epimerase-like enolase superfamily enzyme